MQDAYDPALRALAQKAAKQSGLGSLPEGVYACLPGPTYETPAEVRMVATLGGDLVGMSTVPEVIVARHMGARVLGISCATNRAAGRPGAILDHEDVQNVAQKVGATFIRLLETFIDTLAEEGVT
jgi:purine-nucleoside phosphorylase